MEAQLSRSLEDYLKEIYTLQAEGGRATTSALAKRRGVAPPSGTAVRGRLAALGLVEHERYRGAVLTPAGERAAVEIVRHHRLLEQYLAETLGLGIDAVHEEAELLEHYLSDELAPATPPQHEVRFASAKLLENELAADSADREHVDGVPPAAKRRLREERGELRLPVLCERLGRRCDASVHRDREVELRRVLPRDRPGEEGGDELGVRVDGAQEGASLELHPRRARPHGKRGDAAPAQDAVGAQPVDRTEGARAEEGDVLRERPDALLA